MAAAAAEAILRLRNLCHVKAPSMVNATNSPDPKTSIAVLSLGESPFRVALAGEEDVILGLAKGEKGGDDEVRFALRLVSMGVASSTLLNASMGATARKAQKVNKGRRGIVLKRGRIDSWWTSDGILREQGYWLVLHRGAFAFAAGRGGNNIVC